MTPGQGAARLGRAVLFALSAVGLAAGAHVAGGESVPVLAPVLATPAVAALMNLLAGRRRGLATLLPALAATQVVLHEAFMLTSAPGGCHTTAGHMAGMPGMAASVTVRCMPMTHQGWSTAMLLAHGLATLATAIVLTRGEAAFWTLAYWLTTRAFVSAPRIVVPDRAPAPLVTSVLPATSWTPSFIRRRGPPVAAFST